MTDTPRPRLPIAVCVELGAKRAFASALDWPGWCRSGRDEHLALRALEEYAPRYGVVAAAAGIALPAVAARSLAVVERVAGSTTTDFGAPGALAAADAAASGPAEARRVAALVEASWQALERAVAMAPVALRKGPRGGGRDRDAIAAHVLAAEAAYGRKLGVRLPAPDAADTGAVARLRAAILAVIGAPSDGAPTLERGWPPRYAARRIAWHALDHAWEIEDRSEPAGP
ncbi:MAG TPA: hypothetical protein VMU75_05530 [Acidimicrobiales bacterium]|nr:hypothetical protein [Acidimicrobiales bacterium]